MSVNRAFSQVTLSADGPGNTYDLIISKLAPGENPIEVPDCNHEDFGEHIDELFDEELNTNVFRFFIHVSPDDDRCINFDRQRNEIKTYAGSPDNLLGVQGEKIEYKWKFKLPEGFQSSSSFTHIHQLKPVGGEFASLPMYTLTTRKSNPDRLELRYANTDGQETLEQTPLEPFIGEWVEVTEVISYGNFGSYELSIVRLSDNVELFSFNDFLIANWRPGTEFVRPKWGIYRSLDDASSLRDEEVLFNDFSISEIISSSVDESLFENLIVPNLIENRLNISNIPTVVDQIQILAIQGKDLFSTKTHGQSSLTVDVVSFPHGMYIVLFETKAGPYTKMVVKQKL